MGYTTQFRGELKFTASVTSTGLARLSSLLFEDARDHPDWEPQEFTDIGLRITDTFDGLKWDEEAEKWLRGGQENKSDFDRSS